jgi:hypothetical protein
MRKLRHAALPLLLLAACGTNYYERQGWATKVFEQASAECYTEINRAGGPPNYYLCMKAKGWFETGRCQGGVECRKN